MIKDVDYLGLLWDIDDSRIDVGYTNPINRMASHGNSGGLPLSSKRPEP